MPHDLRILRPATLAGSPEQIIEPTLPLLHPYFRHEFAWGGHTAAIHAQRLRAGDLRPHEQWFYLRLPDGSFHEIQFSRLQHHLDRPPSIASTPCIADAFSREPVQTPAMLARIARLCGLH